MKSPSLWSTISEELFSVSSLISILGVSSLYILLSVILLNYKFLLATTSSTFQLSAKISIFFSLLQGTWTSINHTDFILMIVNAIFFGINILLIIKTLSVIEHQGKVRLSIGGATIISLVTTGCASCGLSIISILGITASLSFLPFYSMLFHLSATLILIFSTCYMLKKLHDGKYCRV